MKVLLLRGNPRQTGYTHRLTDLLLQGLLKTEAEARDVDISALSIAPCLGCFHCWLTEPGQCVHRDDMGQQLEWLLESDVIVAATPLYYSSMSSYLKVFFERTFPLAKPGMVPSGLGLTRNTIRYPERWQGKKLVTLVTGALRDMDSYRPVIETFRLIADSLDLELGGQLIRPESYLLDYPLSKPKTLKRVETAFIRAGIEAGTTGRLSARTMEDASLPLSPSGETFRTYSNLYWTEAMKMGTDGQVPALVQARVGADVRILMREMQRYLDPHAAGRLRAVLQFDFPDENLHFRLSIDHGQCALEEATTECPDLRVSCRAGVWAKVFTRQLDVRDALRDRSLVLEGDKSIFTRLDRLFPPPSV